MVTTPWLSTVDHHDYVVMTCVGLGLLAVEWLNRSRPHALSIAHLSGWMRWSLYTLCCLVILVFGAVDGRDFVYFQF